MKIKAGELDVIASGVVQSFGMLPTTLELLDHDKPLKMVISVVKEDGVNSSISFRAEHAHLLNVRVINPKGLNFGMKEPVKLGTLSGRKFHAMMRVNVCGDYESYSLYYTCFLGEEVSDV